MAKDAYDILGLLGNQQMKNVELVSGLIDSGYKNATAGVRIASDIINTTVNSALNYKQTLVDEWYKTQTLKQRDNELNATIAYHNANLALRSQEIEATKQRYEDLDKRETERLNLQTRNKNVIGFLSALERQYTNSVNGLESEARINANQLDSLAKQLNSGPPKKFSEYKAMTERMEALRQKIEGATNQISRLNADRRNLQDSTAMLINGFVDGDDILKELNFTNPSISNAIGGRPIGVPTVPGPDGSPVPVGRTPSQGSGNIYVSSDPNNAPETFTAVSQDEDKYPLGDSLNIMGDMRAKAGGDTEKVLPQLQNFLANYADAETQKHFEDKRSDLEKKFFKDMFLELTAGKDFASKNGLNRQEFKNDYLFFGGSPNTINNIVETVSTEYQRISEISDPMERNRAIQELASKTLPSEQAKKMNTMSSGVAMPSQWLNPDGRFSTGKEPFIKDEFNETPNSVMDAEIKTESQKAKKAVTDVIGGFDEKGNRVHGYALTKDEKGQSVLSRRAIEKLAGMSLQQMEDLNLIDLSEFEYTDPESGATHSTIKTMLGIPEVAAKLNQKKKAVITNLLKNKTRAINTLIKLDQL